MGNAEKIMKRNYIPAFIMLLAGFITCILGLYYQYSAVRLLVTLFIVLVCFFVLGCFVKSLICHFIPEKTEETEETEETGGDEAEGESEEEKMEDGKNMEE